jgi:hypothetical protein
MSTLQEDERNAGRLSQIDVMPRETNDEAVHEMRPDPETEGEWITHPVAATLMNLR